MNHGIGASFLEKTGNVGLLDQIAGRPPRNEDCGGAEFAKLRDNARSQESRTACDKNSFIGPEVHL
jgi:hypothetical protein